MKIELFNMVGFTTPQHDLIKHAIMASEAVLNWKSWQDEVASYSFSETTHTGRFILNEMANATIQINVQNFHSLSSTIAYTFLHGKIINLNDYFLNQYLQMDSVEGEANVASTIIHEFCHELGYTHRLWWNRANSVPYKMQHVFYRRYVDFYSNNKGSLVAENTGLAMNLKVQLSD